MTGSSNLKHFFALCLSLILTLSIGLASGLASSEPYSVSAINQVTLGVADMDEAEKFYVDAFGFERKGSATYSASDAALALAWRLPAGMQGEIRVLGPAGDSTASIRLMSFSQPGERIWGNYENTQNLGFYAVNFRVQDFSAAWERLNNAGGKARSEPHSWNVLPGVTAMDSMYFDNNGILLDVFQLSGDKADEMFGALNMPVSAVQTVATHTADADRAIRFYQGLGYSVIYDKTLEGLEDLLKLPAGVSLRNINLMKPELTTIGRMELTQYIGYPEESRMNQAAPPNYGALMLSFETTDLARTANEVQALGGKAISGPVEFDLPAVGSAILQTFYGPDGEVLEFYQATPQ